jgi:hypothetical protein
MLTQQLKYASLWISIVFASCSTSFAQIDVIEGRTIRPHGASPVGEYGSIYKLTVSPAKQASPAFKYRLVLPPHETVPGNSITHYLRSDGEKSLSNPWKYAEKESDNKVYDWLSLETKTADIPLDKLKACSEGFDGYVENHIRRAAMCRDADWGIAVEDFRGRETIEFLLPSVQQTRQIARALMLQNRLAVIEKRYDDAVDLLRMTYKLGRDVNEMGFLVTSLVGTAEVGMANVGALHLIAGEDSPNLYWALQELPTPIIDQRRSLRLEASMSLRLFPELMNIENVDYSDDQWKKLLMKYTKEVGEYMTMFQSSNIGSPNDNVGMYSFGFGLAGYASAKQRMIERGYDSDKVASMSVSQVILTDAILDIRYFAQEQEKVFYLPYPEARAFADRWDKEIQKQESTMRLGAVVAGLLSPAAFNVRTAVAKRQAQLNLMIAIESLRHHAAVHGSLPKTLKDLELPVRNNPMTGEAFNYSLESGKAVLTYDAGPYQTQRYEISIKE